MAGTKVPFCRVAGFADSPPPYFAFPVLVFNPFGTLPPSFIDLENMSGLSCRLFIINRFNL